VDLTNRDIRQRDILPREELKKVKATVVGVGAIGRQVAIQLASIGVPYLQLVDPDTVAVENLAAQGFCPEELEMTKVDAVAQMCLRINPDTIVVSEYKRFARSLAIGNVLFCCVDSIDTRKFIWEKAHEKLELFIDGRMSAEVIRVFADFKTDSRPRPHYPTTLFPGSEAHTGLCTARTTIFTANIAAGLMVEQLAKHLRGMKVDHDIDLNLLSMELGVNA
jgi:molybdopterin-synthase adenylyltransferase